MSIILMVSSYTHTPHASMPINTSTRCWFCCKKSIVFWWSLLPHQHNKILFLNLLLQLVHTETKVGVNLWCCWRVKKRASMDSLEEQVFMFIDEQYYHYHSNFSNESELQVEEDLWWQDNSDSDDSSQRTLYWESQVALLQVHTYTHRHHFSTFIKKLCLV